MYHCDCRGGRVIKGGTYGGGSGPIWLDDLECNGTEARIQDCVHKPWGTNNCGHNEDAAVMCLQSNEVVSILHCTVSL